MHAIKLFNSISGKGLRNLPSGRFVSAHDLEKYQGILLRSYKIQEEDISYDLLAIGRAGAGVNNIPVEECTQRGIVVFNTPGANAESVKELVITALFLSSRKIVEGINWCAGLAQDEDVKKKVEKGKANFAGPEIFGKTLGIIGLGAIGVKVANAAAALGMRVLGYDPYISINSAWNLNNSIAKAENLNSLLAASDYISLHLPLNDETRHILDAKRIALMKRGSRLMNFARAELVDDTALLSAINEAKVARYVTDFPSMELIGNSGVITVPHLGGSTPESEDKCSEMAAAQLRDYLEDGNIRNSVNFPAVSLEREGKFRIAIVNRNIPNMLGQISTIIANEGINILEIVNRHRDDIAYNVIDLSASPMAALNVLKDVEGVIKVRDLSLD